MAKRTFGNTWWGRQWLAALEQIDDENRLARGKTYARAGRVHELELHAADGALEALVDGSAYAPYRVRLRLDPIAPKKADALADALAADPEVISALLDRTLSPKVAEISRSLGIDLFPASLRSLHPSCTCPDDAPVCKHAAAVMLELSALIDKRPLTLLRLRGIDLKKALRARGIDLAQAVAVKPLTLEALLANLADALGPADATLLSEAAALETLRGVAYGDMPELTETVLGLIAETLPNTSEKLREPARKALARAAKLVNSVLNAPQSIEHTEGDKNLAGENAGETTGDGWQSYLRAEAEKAIDSLPSRDRPSESDVVHSRIAVSFPDNAVCTATLILSWLPEGKRKAREARIELERGRFFKELLKLSPLEAHSLAPEIECWREITTAAAQCLRAGAVIPIAAVLPIEASAPRLFWAPAVRTSRIAKLVESLAQGVGPWADKLFEGTIPVSQAPNARRRIVLLALMAAAGGLVFRAWHDYARDDRPEGLASCLFDQFDLSSLDGRFADPDAALLLARALKPFVLGDAYPWQPVVTASLREGEVLVNYGILGRGARPDDLAVIEAELGGGKEDSTVAALSAKSRALKLSAHRPIRLSRLLSDPDFAPDRFAALSVLRTLEDAWPQLKPLREEKKPLRLSPSELKDFLFDAAPMLALLGVTVMLPAKLKHLVKPRLVASVSTGGSTSGTSVLGKDALSAFDWQIAVGSDRIERPDRAKLEQLLQSAGTVIASGEDFVYVDPEEIVQLVRTVETQPQPGYLEKMRAVLSGGIDGAEVDVSAALSERMAKLTAVRERPAPRGLRATLRPYQARGYVWLMKNLELGLGALIADDMGLGKTLQVIAAMLELKNMGELRKKKILAVVPTTLIANWEREIAKFAPELTVARYHGAGRALAPIEKRADVTLTSYGLMRRDHAILAQTPWRLLVLDEAQALKNAASGQSAAARALPADQVIAMTGTPVENRLMEYWSILDVAAPKLLGTQKDFARSFARPIEAEHDPLAADAFRRLTAPFMLRRLKSDKSIIPDLPERVIQDQFALLLPEQAALYESVLKSHLEELEALEKAAAETPEKREGARIRRSALVLRLITALKQICNSPSQYLGTRAARPDAGKAALLFEILSQCRDAERKVLIFTQFREMGERLQDWIQAATGERPDFLHGGVPPAKRQAMVDRFQTDRSVRTMIISLKAGGTGLNLTAASAVVHYDLWWNPAVEAQATDRAYRIGQSRDVLVWRFVTAGTFEERINAMLEEKRGLAELTVASGEAWIGDLPAGELKRLFGLSYSPTSIDPESCYSDA